MEKQTQSEAESQKYSKGKGVDAMIIMGKDNCPCCNALIDAATPVDDEQPKPSPGDLTICMYCSAVLYYQDDMAVGEFPKVLYDSMKEEDKLDLIRYQAAVVMMWKESPEFDSKPKSNKQEYGYIYESQTGRD